MSNTKKTFRAKENAEILSIDIGGSNLKAAILDHKGAVLHEYIMIPTPKPATPEILLAAIEALIAGFPGYDYISAGFPGYVKDGVVKTAPNLGTPQWTGVDFRLMLEERLGKPAKLINDADMQGLGVAEGKGLELVITLGTGLGSALIMDGKLLPHLELAHHPVTKDEDYDQYIGEAAMNRIGRTRWNKRMVRVLQILKTVVNYDKLYIGGGNAGALDVPLDSNIQIISNKDGIRGGARLWTIP